MPETNADDILSVVKGFDQHGYVLDESLATVSFLMIKLRRPLLIEGSAGVGKTELAQILSRYLDTELIRLQCYEGLDVHAAIYEWNYQRQLLSIKLQEQSEASIEEKEEHIFSDQFLLKRPLLKAITKKDKAPVLLIDEIDRADTEFEAFLLELLSAFQISIPEIGTIKATHTPYVILTSNGTRELSDALRRRCLYFWMDYPDREKELKIVDKHLPEVDAQLAQQVVDAVQGLRSLQFDKVPGIAETIDWLEALHHLGATSLDSDLIRQTLGCVLKTQNDLQMMDEQTIESLIA
ncbi:MAG: MoxR family ATPase [Rhodothermaceae bacterium]|nr:MoxR family ATPase [Rhodothermaceae bacterium]